jgi:putative thioredoxin
MDTTTDKFSADVLEASRKTPVLVDFWAPWCGPCRVLGPALERLEAEAQGRWRLVKVNTEAEPMLAHQFQISSIPAVKLFRDGKVVAEFVGALPPAQISRWLEAHIPSAAAEDAERARVAREAGRLDEAREILETALRATPQDPAVRVPLAELLWPQDRTRAVTLVEDVPGADDGYERAEAIKSLDRIWDFTPEATDEASPAWGEFARGLEALRRGDYAAAADAWIATVQRDRKLGDDAARRACVALFRWLGEAHPVTQGHRRAFASALY